MAKLVCTDDYENYALRILTPTVKDYYKGGAGEENTLRNNREAFKKIRIRPRVLRNVSNRELTTTVLGKQISMPLGISPTAMQQMAHPDGEIGTAKAAEAANTIYIMSTISTCSIEEVAKAAPNAIKWFQLYVYKDKDVSLSLIRRAEKAGFQALVLTIDSPVYGDRRHDARNNFVLPKHLRLANFDEFTSGRTDEVSNMSEYVVNLYDSALTWPIIRWLKSVTRLPIVIKGVLTAEDALLGVQHGADAIFVSNHGARNIDGTPATIEVLPEIVEAVAGRVEVYLDGGVVQGVDAFKALALGATMVFFGRPVLWGLACGGEKGVREVLEMMRKEIDLAFALAGCSKVSEVTKNMVAHESVYSRL